MRGRPRKPTRLKVLQGTAQPCRTNPKEPQLPVRTSSYPPPTWLELYAQLEWQRLEPMLRATGVLTEGDLATFAAYCSHVAEAQWAVQKVAKAKNDRQRLLWNAIRRKAWNEVVKVAAQLGLTPAARSRVNAAPPDASQKNDDLFA